VSKLVLNLEGVGGAIVNSNAPPPRRMDTAPRVEGVMIVPPPLLRRVSMGMVGGTRPEKMLSTRPKSMRRSGTNRHTCELAYPTFVSWYSRHVSELVVEAEAESVVESVVVLVLPGAAVALVLQGARSEPVARAVKKATEEGVSSP